MKEVSKTGGLGKEVEQLTYESWIVKERSQYSFQMKETGLLEETEFVKKNFLVINLM